MHKVIVEKYIEIVEVTHKECVGMDYIKRYGR